MKKTKRSSKRIEAKRKNITANVMNDEDIKKEITIIAKILVENTTKDLLEEDEPETDEEWLDYFNREVTLLEDGLGALLNVSPEDISRKIPSAKSKVGERQLLQQFTDHLIEITRHEYYKAIYNVLVAIEAHKLRMALREEVRTSCIQSSIQTHRFVTIPSQLDDLIGEERLDLNQEDISDNSMAFCVDIWNMMTEEYPKDCRLHFYLECKDGWYSAEEYGNVADAEFEADRRKEKGEGNFEVKWIEECWAAVLFTTNKPVFVG